MDRETVEKMAKLARIDVSDKEAESLAGELGTILKYVSDLKKVESKKLKVESEKPATRNTMREDDEAHESGLYTEDLLNSAPEKENGYIKVKKILG